MARRKEGVWWAKRPMSNATRRDASAARWQDNIDQPTWRGNVPRHEAHQFGICHVDDTGRITGFVENPQDPPEIPGRPGLCLVSMGNYIFRYEPLMDVLPKDAEDADSKHDFGHNMIPRLVAQGVRWGT